MTASAIYEGTLVHRRLEPRPHAFRYRLSLLYLDLEELPALFERRWLWSARRPAPAWLRRTDYLGPSDRPLEQAVRERVERQLGHRPAGAVRVLTQPRTLGYLFNPVSFYFCHGTGGALEALVAEITNTPWGERHAYVLDARQAAGGERRWRFRKDFHVSPFQALEHDYDWRCDEPGERLGVRMTNLRAGRPVFQAELACRRRALDARGLRAHLVRHPLQPLRLHAAIYWQAARLFLLRTPFHAHPSKRPTDPGPSALGRLDP